MLKYLVIGIIMSIGWHCVKIVYEVLAEILFERLHKQDWYAVACKRMTMDDMKTKKQKKKQNDKPYSKTTIGFMANRDES